MLYIAGVSPQWKQTLLATLPAPARGQSSGPTDGAKVAQRLLVIPRNRQPAKRLIKVAPPATPRLRSSQHVETTVGFTRCRWPGGLTRRGTVAGVPSPSSPLGRHPAAGIEANSASVSVSIPAAGWRPREFTGRGTAASTATGNLIT